MAGECRQPDAIRHFGDEGGRHAVMQVQHFERGRNDTERPYKADVSRRRRLERDGEGLEGGCRSSKEGVDELSRHPALMEFKVTQAEQRLDFALLGGAIGKAGEER